MPSARVRLSRIVVCSRGRERPVHSARLELLAKPEPLASARNVRKLRCELAAVDLLQQREDVLELHPRSGPCPPDRPSKNSRARSDSSSPRKSKLKHRRNGPLPHAERIEIGDLVAAKAVDLDQPRDGGLLLDRREPLASAPRRRCARRAAARAALRPERSGRAGYRRRCRRGEPKYCRHSGGTLPGSARNCS